MLFFSKVLYSSLFNNVMMDNYTLCMPTVIFCKSYLRIEKQITFSLHWLMQNISYLRMEMQIMSQVKLVQADALPGAKQITFMDRKADFFCYNLKCRLFYLVLAKLKHIKFKD